MQISTPFKKKILPIIHLQKLFANIHRKQIIPTFPNLVKVTKNGKAKDTQFIWCELQQRKILLWSNPTKIVGCGPQLTKTSKKCQRHWPAPHIKVLEQLKTRVNHVFLRSIYNKIFFFFFGGGIYNSLFINEWLFTFHNWLIYFSQSVINHLYITWLGTDRFFFIFFFLSLFEW